MKAIVNILTYLKKHKLTVSTAESCTGGQVLALLSKIEGSGGQLDVGFVVYSADAKKRVLGVKQSTIDQYTLTSPEVAIEMVEGAIKKTKANVVIAITGITGDKPMDGIPAGTICFAWGFKIAKKWFYFTKTKIFNNSRAQAQLAAAKYALKHIPIFHKQLSSDK